MTRRTHHRRETALVDGHSACFAQCGRAAGHHPPHFTYSAYCEADQVHSGREVPGSGWMCPRCSVVWGTCGLFDLHLVIRYDEPQPVTCLTPEQLDVDLVQGAEGVWMTPEGMRNRAAFAERNRLAREATS